MAKKIIPNRTEVQKTWPQVYAIITAALISFTCGIFFTWASPTIPKLLNGNENGEITLDEASYLTIIPAVAVVISSPMSGRLLDIFGRKRTLQLIAIPQLIAWILTAVGGNIYVFYAAKFVNGVADACTFATVPTYITEVSTPKVRGTWGNALTFLIYTGNMVMNVVGTYFSIRNSAIILAMIPIVFLILSCFIPETPYYLLMKNDEDEARKSLQWLRGVKNVEDELNQLTYDVKRQLSEPGNYKDVFTIASNRRAVIIGASIRGMQQFSGISAIAMYCQIIFEMAGGDLNPSTSVIIFSATLVIANFIASFFLEKIGRRKVMIISCCGTAILHAILSAFFYLQENSVTNLDSFRTVPIIVLILYVLFFQIGLGLVPTIMLGELFSSSIKGKAMCIMNVFFGIYVCSSSKIFTALFVGYGLYVPFAFFSVCCIFSTFASYYLVPETKGKTLEEIQQSLKSKPKKVISTIT